jgi:anti-anti-sigma factor
MPVFPPGALAMTGAPGLAIAVDDGGPYPTVRLRGELDLTQADRLREALDAVLARRPHLLVADLSGLAFTDCAGLAVLVHAHRRQDAHGGLLLIHGVRPLVRRVLTLTGLDACLHLVPDVDPGGS